MPSKPSFRFFRWTPAGAFVSLFLVASITFAQTAGTLQYSASQLQWGNGASWITVGGAAGSACSTAGQIAWTGTQVEWCNGTAWQLVNAGTSLGSCAVAGQLGWYATSSYVTWCNGTNFYELLNNTTCPASGGCPSKTNGSTCTTYPTSSGCTALSGGPTCASMAVTATCSNGTWTGTIDTYSSCTNANCGGGDCGTC